MIPYGKQDICQADIDSVVAVLKSDFLTQGPVVKQFEQGIAKYCQVDYAIAASSATACLHLSCLALDVGNDDIVWTSPISFVASSNCALYCGAKIGFVDVESDTGLMCVIALKQKLNHAKLQNKLPKVVIPVHLAGQSCDMKSIAKLAQEYGFKVIEDASHAIGARYQELPVGNCHYSDICVFSFHPVKIITTAEGGVATTNQVNLAKKLKMLSSHGITRNPEEMTEQSHGSWYYQQIALGFNYRMSELHAALGLSQLARLDEFVNKRNNLTKRYLKKLADLPLRHLNQYGDRYSSYHLFIIQLNDANQHAKVFEQLSNSGIGVNLHYIPIHLQPYYKQLGFKLGDFLNAEKYYQKSITLPLHPNLTIKKQDYIIKVLTDTLQH
jgi:UDP-4-amino-4,6-dideoxy-N-acetyl-beta-L-altrosamine transaminase